MSYNSPKKNPTPQNNQYVNVNYHFLRDVTEKGVVVLEKIHTDHNPANMVTKSVTFSKLVHCKSFMKMNGDIEK